jgi:hypothetical protein
MLYINPRERPARKVREDQQICSCHNQISRRGRANPYVFYSPSLVYNLFIAVTCVYVQSRASMFRRQWRQLTILLTIHNFFYLLVSFLQPLFPLLLIRSPTFFRFLDLRALHYMAKGNRPKSEPFTFNFSKIHP